MKDDALLYRLAKLAGIESHYWDIAGNRHETSPVTVRRLLSAMGFACDNDNEIASSLTAMQEKEWRRLLPPVMVMREDRWSCVPLHLAAETSFSAIDWRIALEDRTVKSGTISRYDLTVEGSRSIDGCEVQRLMLPLPAVPPGYHQLDVNGIIGATPMSLIVAPSKCYLPASVLTGRKCWGIAAQLYSVKSAQDWGIGDFTVLSQLAQWAATVGADALGLNPLHALFPTLPENASPYSPNSRLFRNAIYIDVTAIADYAVCALARQRMASPAFREALAAARDKDLVDYTTVSRLKFEILELLYATFRDTCLSSTANERGQAFRRFQNECGHRLRNFVLFQALCEIFSTNDWTRWPSGFRDPLSAEVKSFEAENEDRLSFFEYVQWQADLQIAAAAAQADKTGMDIGLYGDVAVSVDPSGADHWGRQDIYASGARIGAPPDPFNDLGQEWGVVPMNPWRLRDDAYADFITLLRANMRHTGALRIDHVMGLQHLYWVPTGCAASTGAYVTYPFDDLLGILALESHRHRCLVVGEALGTVPEGFRPRMAQENILSYHVLYFENKGDRKRPPADYPDMAVACVSTHDLATLKGFWNGIDLDKRRDLGLYQSPEEDRRARDQRRHDKWLLLRALADDALLPGEIDINRPDDMEMTHELASAIHAYLARSSACLLMVQLDDIIGEEQQVNLPGTHSQYPNWRRRLTLSLDAIAEDPAIAAMLRRIAYEREKNIEQ